MWITFILSLCFIFCPVHGQEHATDSYSQEEFKCSLPDVKSIDTNLDITRFRTDFSKISEVKFPGLIGPLNERLICKIKCIDGNWVGPLCSSTPDGRFQPVLRECMYRHDHPLLAITFKNSSIEKDTWFPHGSEIVARCRQFGLYKLKGEPRLRCDNGAWPEFPDCVPTALLTNFTGSAPPSVRWRLVAGSGTVGPAGELQLFPESALRLECVTRRADPPPLWTWTSPLRHTAAWSTEDGETDTVYRLSLSRLPARHSDSLTCTTSEGLTHTVHIVVVNVSCPAVYGHGEHLTLHGEGWQLGHSQHFSCAPGYHLEGPATITCMGDGRWSGPVPSCAATQCPPLEVVDPQLTLVDFNASWGGRALFRCAWGYRLLGAPGLECERDGTWSARPPTCSPIYCPVPPVPAHARLVSAAGRARPAVGDLATYACEPGYHILGEPSIVCTENGYWSHPPPFCLPPSQIRKADTIYVENTTLVHIEE